MIKRRLLPRFSVAKVKPVSIEAPVKNKPAIDVDVLSAIQANVLEEANVYVHCYLDNYEKDMLIRIWKTTFLVDRSTGAKSRLIHAENVSFAPLWTMVPDGVTYNFLLVFAALPKSCQEFDLIEQVPTSGGFHIRAIQRNMKDVYHINLL